MGFGALSVGKQVLQGLSALHKSGIVRREVKPENVMLNELAGGKLPGEKLCRGGLGIFIRKCTEFDPNRRFQTSDQVLRRTMWPGWKSNKGVGF